MSSIIISAIGLLAIHRNDTTTVMLCMAASSYDEQLYNSFNRYSYYSSFSLEVLQLDEIIGRNIVEVVI